MDGTQTTPSWGKIAMRFFCHLTQTYGWITSNYKVAEKSIVIFVNCKCVRTKASTFFYQWIPLFYFQAKGFHDHPMPESKNSSELRKLPGYKRRATETRRASKRSRMEQISSKPLTPGPGVASTLPLSHDDTFYSMESDTSTGVQFQSYNCDVSPTPMMHCTGSKSVINIKIIFMLNEINTYRS